MKIESNLILVLAVVVFFFGNVLWNWDIQSKHNALADNHITHVNYLNAAILKHHPVEEGE